MSDDKYNEYSRLAKELLGLISKAKSQIMSMSDIEMSIETYKNCFSILNRIINVDSQEITQRNAYLSSKWDDLVKINTESAVTIVIDNSYHPQSVNKAIHKLEELISQTKKRVESFLGNYVTRYNSLVSSLTNEFYRIESQLCLVVEGFDLRRQSLNNAKHTLFEFRMTLEELDIAYGEVKRAGMINLAVCAPEQVRSKIQELFNKIDQKFAELENEIQLVNNLKISEQRFYELKRIFAQYDINKTGKLGFMQLSAILNISKRKKDQVLLKSLLADYGNGCYIDIVGFLHMMAADAARLLKQDPRDKEVKKGRIFTKGIHHV